jgi:hypothetical protein
VRRGAFLWTGLVVVVVAAVVTINRVVDPRDEFYSGEALAAALNSHCLLADNVVRARSYAEFKQDLFRRRPAKTVVLGWSDGARPRRRPFVDMGFPGFGPSSLLVAMRFLADVTPAKERLRVLVVTSPAWFDPDAKVVGSDKPLLSRLGYVLSPFTLASSLDLMRRSRTLAFTGWHREPLGRTCVIDRGRALPAWRADGTLVGAGPQPVAAGSGFAWNRLSAVDHALAIARDRGWHLAGFSVASGSAVYARELSALFAKHAYRWLIRKLGA